MRSGVDDGQSIVLAQTGDQRGADIACRHRVLRFYSEIVEDEHEVTTLLRCVRFRREVDELERHQRLRLAVVEHRHFVGAQVGHRLTVARDDCRHLDQRRPGAEGRLRRRRRLGLNGETCQYREDGKQTSYSHANAATTRG